MTVNFDIAVYIEIEFSMELRVIPLTKCFEHNIFYFYFLFFCLFFFGLHFCLQDLPNNDFLYHINTLGHFVEFGSENKTHYHMHPHTDRHTDSG